jgi:hypothetical protein
MEELKKPRFSTERWGFYFGDEKELEQGSIK